MVLASIFSASLARDRSLSITRQPNAHRIQNITKMSSRAARLVTSSRPSRARSSPAAQPSSVEPVIRRAIRARTRTARVPITAGMKRQPNGVAPNSHSPMAIIHLPAGGWAMKLPPSDQICGFHLSVPGASRIESAFCSVLCSYPNFSSARESLA